MSTNWAVELEAEARRVYARYVQEFVEAMKLCPWAEPARRDGRVRVEVVLESNEELQGDPAPALAAIESLADDPQVQVGLVLFPRVELERQPFERVVARWRELDTERNGGTPEMALAAFHPDAPASLDDASRLVPFIRRSPDPTIQCVRCSVLADVRRKEDHGTGYVDPSTVDLAEFLARPAKPPLHERVAESNRQTILRETVERAEAILRSIREDRNESYERILRTMNDLSSSGRSKAG